jgi:thioredoxin-like negative regulator of GroEL
METTKVKKILSAKNETNELSRQLLNNKPLLIEVRAECCGGSNLINSIVQRIESEFNNDIRIFRIDYKTQKELLPEIVLESIPTVLLMKGGKLLKILNGTIARANLKTIVNDLYKSNQN